MLFNIDQTKQCANFRHTLPSTKRQTDIKHSIFAREIYSFSPTIYSDLELSVFPILCFISVCRFVEGNVCPKFAHCFVQSILKSVNFYFNLLCVLICFLESQQSSLFSIKKTKKTNVRNGVWESTTKRSATLVGKCKLLNDVTQSQRQGVP